MCIELTEISPRAATDSPLLAGVRTNVQSLLDYSLNEKKRNFLETVELQIGLKNYDPQRDKRLSVCPGILPPLHLRQKEQLQPHWLRPVLRPDAILQAAVLTSIYVALGLSSYPEYRGQA